MRVIICCLLVATLTLSACSNWRGSNANPRNWFGGNTRAPSAQPTAVPLNPSDRQTGNPLIEDEESANLVFGENITIANSGGLFRPQRQVPYTAPLVDQINNVFLERLPDGVLLRVIGETLREEAFEIRLIQVNPDGAVNGVLEFTFNAYQPADFGRGTENTRRVEVAEFVSNTDLVDVREIRIRAVRNTVSVRP